MYRCFMSRTSACNETHVTLVCILYFDNYTDKCFITCMFVRTAVTMHLQKNSNLREIIHLDIYSRLGCNKNESLQDENTPLQIANNKTRVREYRIPQ